MQPYLAKAPKYSMSSLTRMLVLLFPFIIGPEDTNSKIKTAVLDGPFRKAGGYGNP